MAIFKVLFVFSKSINPSLQDLFEKNTNNSCFFLRILELIIDTKLLRCVFIFKFTISEIIWETSFSFEFCLSVNNSANAGFLALLSSSCAGPKESYIFKIMNYWYSLKLFIKIYVVTLFPKDIYIKIEIYNNFITNYELNKLFFN